MGNSDRGEYQLTQICDSNAPHRQPSLKGCFAGKLFLKLVLLVAAIFGIIATIRVSVYNHPNRSVDLRRMNLSRSIKILLYENSSISNNELMKDNEPDGDESTFDYGSLSQSEKDSLDSLLNDVEHKLTHSYMKTYNYLIRWLRVRDWDVEDAREMLLDHLEWRDEFDMDSIMEANFTFFEREFPYYSDGINYAGLPVITMSIGDWDLRKISVGGTQREFLRYCVKGFEQTAQFSFKKPTEGRITSKATLIMNVDNFSFSRHGCFSCTSILGQLLFAMGDNYPGLLNHLIIINASSLAEGVIELLMPYIGEENRAALKVFGFNKQEWQREILNLTATDQIRREFGGTKDDMEF